MREGQQVGGQSERTRRFAANMRALRRQRGWSAQRLSDRVGALREAGVVEIALPRPVIANLENQRREHVSLDEAFAVAAALGTTVGWLCDFDGPACTQCLDNPPVGYACKVCKADTDVRFKPHMEPKEES
jgi:transcriptional regulator with XRE-family HTH domain